MQGKGKHILEEGKSSTHQYKQTARMSRRSLVTEWLQRMDDLETDGPPPSNKMRSLMTQTDSPSGQPSIEVDQAGMPLKADLSGQGLESEPIDTLKIDSGEGDLQLPQVDQLRQEMDWMEEFNRNTLERQEATLQLERFEDSDPLQYIQEPPEEENQMEDLEEDPEEKPQNVNPVGELNRKNQAEPGGEPAGAEAEADEDDEEKNENEEENDDGEENADEEDEDAEENDEADDDENEDDEEDDDENDDEVEDDNEEEADDEDEDGEAVDEDVGTASPTSTITTV